MRRRSITGAFLGVVAAHAARGADWGYTAKGHHVPPVDWGDVSKTCRIGKSQSPIAISTLSAVSEHIVAPHISYGEADLTVFNNGHTIEAEVEHGAGEIEIEGTIFDLIQFHIHWGSVT